MSLTCRVRRIVPGTKMMQRGRAGSERQTAILSPPHGTSMWSISEPHSNLASLLPESEEGSILLWLLEKSAQLIVIKQATLYFARHVRLSGNESADADADAELPDVGKPFLLIARSNDYFERSFRISPPT